ncbi:MAG: FG-GAP-like repeat-containing protein [Planctomycetes bacterium]|nr:FG-GAP-like repeat-containing protein [Planctomycetota bacterium]
MKKLMTMTAGILLASISSAQLADSPERDDLFGAAIASGDFNGDGYMDQAIGVPGESISSRFETGAVHVLWGSGHSGLMLPFSKLWHQDTPGVPGVNEVDDHFGSVLAAGDFNGDGYHDLAIGTPDEDIGTIGNAGLVTILYGSVFGLTSSGSQSFHQNTPGIAGVCETGDRLGNALTAGDYNNDGKDDLVIGVCDEAIGSKFKAGMIHLLYGTSGGLTTSGSRYWHQDLSTMPGSANTLENFGFALTSGDFNGDNICDFAVGVPNDKEGLPWALKKVGSVNLFRGTPNGACQYVQSLKGVTPGGTHNGGISSDLFGFSLASGDINNDGTDDLLVGSPGQNGSSGAAEVVLFRHSHYLSSSYSILNQRKFTQSSNGVSDSPETSDMFGRCVAMGDFNGDNRADIAISTPWEDFNQTTLRGVGLVHILYGTSSGITSTGAATLSQNTPGVHGACEKWDYFGTSLAVGDYNGDGRDDLSIGVPKEDIGSTIDGGMIHVFRTLSSGGNLRHWQYWMQ